MSLTSHLQCTCLWFLLLAEGCAGNSVQVEHLSCQRDTPAFPQSSLFQKLWGLRGVVGTETRYGLDGPRFELLQGQEVFLFSKNRYGPLWAHPTSY